MTDKKPKSESEEQEESFTEFVERVRTIGVELDITRDEDYGRVIDFGPDDAEAESDEK